MTLEDYKDELKQMLEMIWPDYVDIDDALVMEIRNLLDRDPRPSQKSRYE